MPSYLYTALTTAVRGRMYSMQGVLADERVTLNNAVREVVTDIDLRSSKRKSAVAPDLFNDIYQYSCPTDLKANKIIGIQPQNFIRDRFSDYNLVGEEEFDLYKMSKTNLIFVFLCILIITVNLLVFA